MATLQVLKSAYSDVARIKFSAIASADLGKLQALAQQVDANALSLTDARVEIAKMVSASTTVASLSYAFFTGATPSALGFDYLVSPTGGNSNNLNSAYYQSFSAENRFINFSVNLGKNGAGKDAFTAAYGALDLTAATTKAYAAIFGFAPAAGLIETILTAQVPNGQGGTFTRADYFAYYGGDGLNGVGTKAAVVGWLMNEAVKADLGVYAKANDAFLADLANDGQAVFNTDLLGTYGAQPVYAAGATIAVTDSQSVSPGSATTSLQSTTNNDTVTGTTSSASIATSGGHDTITFTGTVGGFIDGGDGNDTISVGQLNAAVEVLGGAVTGKISGGAGNDLITVGKMVNGAIVDGGAGDDTLVMGADTDLFDKTKITNVEHLVLQNFKLSVTSPTLGTTTVTPLTVTGYAGLQDITVRSANAVRIDDIADGVALKLDGMSGGGLTANYHSNLVISGMSSVEVGARAVDVYLAGVTTSSANPTKLTVTANDGPLNLHVQTDSVLDTIHSQRSASNGGTLSPLVVTGTGKLTAAIDASSVDASGSAGVNFTRVGGGGSATPMTIVLSGEADRVAADLRVSSAQTYTLGGGADVFTLYQDGASAPRFSNVLISDGKVSGLATITDFAKGVDKIDLGAAIAAVSVAASAGAATTLEQALINASASIAANATAVFEYNGDTYIYHQDATVGVNTGDGLIRLVGVTGLTVGTGASNVDIHYG